MAILYVNGSRLKRAIHSSTTWLLSNEQKLNEINVFPVPDGDTGTNMALTLKSIVKSLTESNGDHLPYVAGSAAQAALMGARGNSGVILSQIFKGFSESVGDKTRLSAMDMALALKRAYEKAHQAITEPKEGTILTVVREGVDAAYEQARKDPNIIAMIEALLTRAHESLLNTPNLLPALKEAGVVDAGAMGFVFIIEGIYRLLKGEKLPALQLHPSEPGANISTAGTSSVLDNFYGYCNEFLIHGKNLDVNQIRSRLLELGDSLIVAEAQGVVKVHVHSPQPGRVLDESLKFGVLTDIKIENMDRQHAEVQSKPIKKDAVIISVAPSKGLARIFQSLGCDYVVEGGQTMNPSVEDLNRAIAEFDAEDYVILPNNSNVILAAQQAKSVSNGRRVHVIPTRSAPEGFAALLAYNPEFPVSNNLQNMNQAFTQVKTGEVTTAARDTSMNGVNIKAGDIIALSNRTILGTFPDPDAALLRMVQSLVDDDSGVISVYYGKDVAEAQAQETGAALRQTYTDLDVEVHDGGQPHYFYIASVE